MAYLDSRYVSQSDLKTIHSSNEEKYLRNKEIYVGVAVSNELSDPIIRSNKYLLKDYYFYDRLFLIKSATGICNRYDFSDPLLKFQFSSLN